jgi:hypothetical protein
MAPSRAVSVIARRDLGGDVLNFLNRTSMNAIVNWPLIGA